MYFSITELKRIERGGQLPTASHLYKSRDSLVSCILFKSANTELSYERTVYTAITIADKYTELLGSKGSLYDGSMNDLAEASLIIASKLEETDILAPSKRSVIYCEKLIYEELGGNFNYPSIDVMCYTLLGFTRWSYERETELIYVLNVYISACYYEGVYLEFLPTVLSTVLAKLVSITGVVDNVYDIPEYVLNFCEYRIRNSLTAFVARPMAKELDMKIPTHYFFTNTSFDESSMDVCMEQYNPSFYLTDDKVPYQHTFQGSLGCVVSKGSQGEIRVSGNTAIKTFFNIDDAITSCYCYREISAMYRLKHKNVIRMKVVGNGYYGMELMDGELSELKRTLVFLGKKTQLSITSQIIKGMEHIHACGVLHRDIKLGNILYSKTERGIEIKIADFGLSRIFTESVENIEMTGEVITLYYRPPELIVNTKDFVKYNYECDVWSTGVTLHELFGTNHFMGNRCDKNTTVTTVTKRLEKMYGLTRGQLKRVIGDGELYEPIDGMITYDKNTPDEIKELVKNMTRINNRSSFFLCSQYCDTWN